MDYDDIIHLPHPVSSVHPPMPLSERAAQFAPFAALNGFDEAIADTTRKSQRKTMEREMFGEDET